MKQVYTVLWLMVVSILAVPEMRAQVPFDRPTERGDVRTGSDRGASSRSDRDWDRDDEDDDDDGWKADRRKSRSGRRASKRRDNAPAFCRSGAGHPVHGRQWCLDKGYGLGSYGDRRVVYGGRGYDDRRLEPRWERRRWEPVIFGRAGSSRLDRGDLRRLLGRAAYDRLDAHRRALYLDAPLLGAWVSGNNRSRVLYVSAGDVPVARLVDANGDRRVDTIYVNDWR